MFIIRARILFRRFVFYISNQYLRNLCREFIVDLIGKPGDLSEPDSLLNGPSSISISSPLRPPNSRSTEITENWRSLAQQYFSECQSINLLFTDTSEGTLRFLLPPPFLIIFLAFIF